MIFKCAFVCVALFAVAQGAAVAQIKDVAFELDGQEYHLHPIEKRQTESTNVTATPDEVGAKINKPPHNSPSQCKSIDLPATLSLKVCGCKNPGCPHCPCNNHNKNEGSGSWEESKSNESRSDKDKKDTKKDTKNNNNQNNNNNNNNNNNQNNNKNNTPNNNNNNTPNNNNNNNKNVKNSWWK